MKVASPRGEVPSLSRRRGVTSMQTPLSRLTATAAPGRTLLPYGQFTLSPPRGAFTRPMGNSPCPHPRGASRMTCIGRQSLSSGRGAELVEAERGDIDANPSQSPYGDSRPRAHSLALRAIHLVPLRGALVNSPCLPFKGRWLRA